MALNISAWSIRNPLPSVVFSIILLVLGYVSFTKLAVTRLPSADIPVISVAVSQFGAAPAELESQVTKTIEDGVSGVEGVRHISSSITDGLSLTTIQFALETNTDRALNDVKDAVTRVRANLPQNVTEPLIQRVDVIEDLHRWQPRLILIQRCQDPAVHCQVLEDRHDDLLAWFLRDPIFVKLWKNYTFSMSRGEFDAYTLTTPSPGAASTH